MINKRLIWIFVLILLISVVFPIDYINQNTKNFPLLEIFGFFLLFLYFRAMNRECPAFLYTSFYQIYSLGGIAISLLVVSFGTPMIEISKEGNANGAFWITLLFLILGLETGKLGYLSSSTKTLVKTLRFNQELSEKAAYTAATFVLIIGLYIFFVYGSPMTLSVSRVYFWQNIVSVNFSLYPSLLGQTFFLTIFIYLNRKSQLRDSKSALIFCALYILTTIIVAGEKFSTFIFYITAMLAIYAGLLGRINLNFKLLLWVFAVAAAIFSLIVFNYLSAGLEATFVLYRIALQGQLVWSVVNEELAILISGNISSCYFGCGIYENGTDYISARYLRPGLWASYQETGSGLTGFMPSIPLLQFGLPIALILHMGISFLFGTLQRVLVKVISQRDIIVSLLLFKLYFGLLVLWYASKTSAIPGVVVTIIILFIWILFFNKNHWRTEFKNEVQH